MDRLPERQCGFLVRDSVVPDDALAVQQLMALGWNVVAVPWRRSGIDWTTFDLVVIRSAWDYHRALPQFLDVLTDIDRSTRLENSLDLVRWNTRKTYLQDLAAAGAPTVPTVYRDRLEPGSLETLIAELDGDEVVLKPVVGASAEGSHRIDRASDRLSEIEEYFRERAVMAQPLVRTVLEEGEYSLFYFNGEYSHAVLKAPKPGDFRVQEEYGGTTRPTDPNPQLRAAADRALAASPEVPLYARVDLVRSPDGESFWIMELELIEPVLFLAMDGEAPARFAAAADGRSRM